MAISWSAGHALNCFTVLDHGPCGVWVGVHKIPKNVWKRVSVSIGVFPGQLGITCFLLFLLGSKEQ